jgi:hypothetical protein
VAAVVVGVIDSLNDMTRNQERACPYCITGAIANFAMAPLAAAEAAHGGKDWMVLLSRRAAS